MREETDLRLGLEADFVPGAEDRTANLLDVHDFDYVVGSVHFLRDDAVDMEEYTVWTRTDPGRSAEQIWRRYFETLGEAARSGLFDILAHPDLVKVWGPERPRPEGDLRRYYELALEASRSRAIAVEVSTAGLRKRAREIYPAPAFLEMCVEAGAPVALSSDAHRPEDVGADYEQALELLEQRGCRRAVRVRAPRAAPGADRRGCAMSLSGIGYDCHRFAAGRRLVLGGVEIPHERGLEGHSDADVAHPRGDRRAARGRWPGGHRRALPRHRRALPRRRLAGAAGDSPHDRDRSRLRSR